jgi:hypothetical protein
VTVNGANSTVSAFSATAKTYTVSGTVKNVFLAQVTLSLNGATVATVNVSFFNNAYTFANVPNGTYTVTPTQAGYTFTPTSATVTVNGANSSVAAFNASGGFIFP